jgi:hypothetical protein
MDIKRVAAAFVVGVLALLCSATAEAQVQVSFRDGRVTLAATSVSLPEILAAWEEVGGTKMVHVGRLPPEPVTLSLEDVPEVSALRVLLSRAAGYLARDRGIDGGGRSRLSILMVLGENDRREGGAAARKAMDEAVAAIDARQPASSIGDAIIDYRDLPPRLPGDPNGPVGLTPATIEDTEPPPLTLPEGATVGLNPGVNPIPANIPPPPPPVIMPPTTPGGTQAGAADGIPNPTKPVPPGKLVAVPGKPPGIGW